MKKLGLLLATLLFASIGWGQNTYTKFAPANGVLKGSTTTYVTTAAADADIIGLWSGSCSNVTYLRGDGTCATPPGTGGGTVNSVALAAPTVFSVSGSPVTNTGTLTLAFATGQTANEFLATPDGTTGAVGLRVITTADLPAIPLTTGVTGTLPTGNGGTGEAGTFTGVRKANSASADTAAVAADVYGLWSGTCSSATFLRGDGSCAAPATGGTVTSVGLSWTGSGITVGGTPVTTSGTLALSGTLNATTGGTGEAGTITGVVKGNATSAMTAAVAADVYGLWSGTCSSSTFLRGDGSCAAPAGATGANPSASVGLTANNGSATTYMRSDGSPALDQTIAPTWTSLHTFHHGSVMDGVVGSVSPDRQDAQLILTNLTAGSGHALLDLFNVDKTDEAAITFDSEDSTGAPVQITGQYTRFVNSVNTSTNWQGVWGIHLQDPVNGDCNLINAWSGGALQLLAPCATMSPWNSPPPNGWVNVHGSVNANTQLVVGGSHAYSTTSGYALEVDGFAQVGDVDGSNTTNHAVQIGWSSGSSLGFIQAYSNDSAVFEPLTIGATVLTLSSSSGVVVGSATGGAKGNGTINATGMYVGGVIVPSVSASNTWATLQTFTPTTGRAANFNGIANTVTVFVQGSSTSGQSDGLFNFAGTTSADTSMQVSNQSGSTSYVQVVGDGGVVVGAPTGADKGLGSINAQSMFVNNSAVCTASGANCPATAALLFSTAQVANTGSICSVSNNVNISSCTISSTGVVVVNFSASYTSFKNCTANSAPGVPAVMTMVAGGTSSVTVESFDGSAIGSPVNVGFTIICFGT